MSASLEALIDFIRENHTIEEIVGGSGCVSWVSQVEDTETARSLEPGTLAVTSGLVVKTDNELDELIKALSESRAAGLIITSGLTPTEKLIPLFRMPTGTKTPRLIRDCGHFLMRQESKELNVVRAMKSILAGSGRNDPALRYLEQHGFPSMSRYYLLASEDQVGAEGGAHSCSFRYGGCLLTVLCTDDRIKCLEAAEDCDGAVGIAAFRSPDELPTAYRQALSAMKTAKLSGKSPVFYGSDGIFGLARQLAATDEAKYFADDLLRPIKEYDESERSDYMKTLRAYMKCSGSVQDAADLLGIHRNTVNNKIRFIKENFGLSFDYAGIAAIVTALAIDEIATEKGEI